MLVIFGSRMFGKTDVVPGVCHVVTKFFHINFLPLIPLESYVVITGSDKDGSFRGKQIGMCLKSVLTAWARAAMVIAGTISAVMVLACHEGYAQAIPSIGATILCWSLFYATYRLGKASVARSICLARELGIDEAHLEKAFGADALAMAKI